MKTNGSLNSIPKPTNESKKLLEELIPKSDLIPNDLTTESEMIEYPEELIQPK